MQRRDLLVDAIGLDSERQDPALVILDCRSDLLDRHAGRRAYLDGHVPGARFADLEEDLSASISPGSGRHPLPSPEQAAEVFRRLGVSVNSRVVVYDDKGGAYAARAWWMLRWLGHSQVRLLDGGYPAWINAGLTTESGDVETPYGDFRASPAANRVVVTRQLMQLDMKRF